MDTETVTQLIKNMYQDGFLSGRFSPRASGMLVRTSYQMEKRREMFFNPMTGVERYVSLYHEPLQLVAEY